MKASVDGPKTPNFSPVALRGNIQLNPLSTDQHISEDMRKALEFMPHGSCVAWGIPFEICDDVVLIADRAVTATVEPLQAGWLVFQHTSDSIPLKPGPGGFITPMRGEGRLNEHAADYIVCFADGSEERIAIRRRYEVGSFQHMWGERCFVAVAAHKPRPTRASHEQPQSSWGHSQTRADAGDYAPFGTWLFSWQNPHPEKTITALRFEPAAGEGGALLLLAVSAGSATEQPLRWKTRRKAVLALPDGIAFLPDLDNEGQLAQVALDMGTIISAKPRLIYPDDNWTESYNNKVPEKSISELLIEYTAHPDACFHVWDGRVIPVAEVENMQKELPLRPVAAATRRVNLKVVEKGSRRLVAAKLHVHGAWGEYLAPVDRHRIVNPAWFEDYSVDIINRWIHQCTYIPGETWIDLPLGKVYVEISKGFEIRPIRTLYEIHADTQEIVFEIEKLLPWREQGWVTADTHVHFLSPGSAMLEGAGEGVNVVNLLASQWGDLMTNVGDFDGHTTWGTAETGGGPQQDGEYLVRVGTENRQHVMGHISLLGYSGQIIAPMTTGGPDESAIGDPIEILLTEWARQCKKQQGLVVLPHFPNPRAEHAASIVSGNIDAVEMTSWGELYAGISPYSLADWYRYLNCGYQVAAVGGTDKMSADTAVGTVRTYARIPLNQPFSYQGWMDAVRRGETFVTYGPLLEFSVDGHAMGSRTPMNGNGGTVDVTWQVSSVTVPVSRVELIVNGEIRESVAAGPEKASGSWRLKVERSSWLALLVRGHYPDQPEIVAAHSSPVMIDVPGSQVLAAADAVTILEQIEGALTYLDVIGTRAEERIYRRMRLELEGAHRSLHNRMHQAGHFHEHGPLTHHS